VNQLPRFNVREKHFVSNKDDEFGGHDDGKV